MLKTDLARSLAATLAQDLDRRTVRNKTILMMLLLLERGKDSNLGDACFTLDIA